MSDTHRRYCAIRQAFLQLYPKPPEGHQAQHFTTLVAMVCGIIGSQSVQLPKIAMAMPADSVQRESVIRRMKRWMMNKHTDVRITYLPFAQHILHHCAKKEITIAFDGSALARNCVALVASVIYHKRAIPLAWVIISGKKGHFPESTHCDLLTYLHTIIPEGTVVTIVGDGEFDGTDFLKNITAYGWRYVCRTACTILLTVKEKTFHIGDISAEKDTTIVIEQTYMTAERYGPLNALVIWNDKVKEPIYLVTNIDDAETARTTYLRRFMIETLFSDQKGRGFHVASSHIDKPERVDRLFLAACLAYIWVIYLGVQSVSKDWMKRIHRHDRCDISLFQLGLRMLAWCLTEDHDIPATFGTIDLYQEDICSHFSSP